MIEFGLNILFFPHDFNKNKCFNVYYGIYKSAIKGTNSNICYRLFKKNLSIQNVVLLTFILKMRKQIENTFALFVENLSTIFY